MHETVRRPVLLWTVWLGCLAVSCRHGRLPPLLVVTSCGDAGNLGL